MKEIEKGKAGRAGDHEHIGGQESQESVAQPATP